MIVARSPAPWGELSRVWNLSLRSGVLRGDQSSLGRHDRGTGCLRRLGLLLPQWLPHDVDSQREVRVLAARAGQVRGQPGAPDLSGVLRGVHGDVRVVLFL